MKRTLLGIILIVGLTMSSSMEAQNRRGREDGRRNIQKEMQLTFEQQKKMQDIDAQYKEKGAKIRTTKLTADERRNEMDKLRKEKMDAKKQVLTAEQQKYFGERGWNKKDGRKSVNKNWNRGQGQRGFRSNCPGCCCSGASKKVEMRGPGQGVMKPGMRGGYPYITEDLNLTDDQKTKIEKLWNDNQKDREQMRTKHREDMKKILTSEQLKKFEDRWSDK